MNEELKSLISRLWKADLSKVRFGHRPSAGKRTHLLLLARDNVFYDDPTSVWLDVVQAHGLPRWMGGHQWESLLNITQSFFTETGKYVAWIEMNPESWPDEVLHPLVQPHIAFKQMRPKFLEPQPSNSIRVGAFNSLSTISLGNLRFVYSDAVNDRDCIRRQVSVRRRHFNLKTLEPNVFTERWHFNGLRGQEDNDLILDHQIPAVHYSNEDGLHQTRFVTLAKLSPTNTLDIFSLGFHPKSAGVASIKEVTLSCSYYSAAVPALVPLLTDAVSNAERRS